MLQMHKRVEHRFGYTSSLSNHSPMKTYCHDQYHKMAFNGLSQSLLDLFTNFLG